MFGRVMNMSLHIPVFRLKQFPVKGTFNDCGTVKLKNKRTNKGYMGIINISCYLGNIVSAKIRHSFYMVICFFEFVTTMSIRFKFSEKVQLSEAKCNRNNQNLKQRKTF